LGPSWKLAKADDDHDLDALVERSRQQFVDTFPADFEALTALTDAAATGDDGALANLRLAAHRLVGRAGILEFVTLARHAAALEIVARVDQARHFDAGAAAACLTAIRDAFAEIRPWPAARPLILVADDDADQRFLLTRLLQRAGFEVEAVATGAELLPLARQRRPAAILLEVRKPRQDGYRTGQKLRGDPETAAIPVMFLSGLSVDGDATSGNVTTRAEGEPRRIDPVELIDRVRALCARITTSSG
jgi:CheY-like chemotaxis protein